MKSATKSKITQRELLQTLSGIPTADGDGVKLTRIIGSPYLDMLDPFLLLDSFETDQPQDYVGGFPSHPHRGFETVTYLLAGRVRHKDNAGHEGLIEPEGVQWMTAGKGIVHSEMPEQQEGLLHGFQLWVNLPQSAKMIEPKYQEFSAEEIPRERQDNGTVIRVIAGKTDQGTQSPVQNQFTKPTYMDVSLPAGETFSQSLMPQDNAFIYVVSGILLIGGKGNKLRQKQLGVLSHGNEITIKSENSASRFLLIAGKPLNEPVERGGPFVMNTKKEVMQAFEDFRNNRF